MPTPAKNPAPPPAGCLWTPQAAHYIGLSLRTLYTYKAQGKAPTGCFEVARKLAWPIDGLDAWLAAQRQQATPSPDSEHDSRPLEPKLARRRTAPKPADDAELQPAAA
ncbi:hypothetical protein [Streptomyces sp. NPDC094149]|uniref:helix-turn-helix transcriptional regulator n=1 Tax=Streptomyces sp. NPDC094149 TaxID=3155079 RepID=UPI00331BA25B